MKIYNKVKKTAIFSVCALSASIYSASQAYEFEVGDTTASVYGYTKLDMIYDFDNQLGDTVGRSAPRLNGEEGSDGHFSMTARESRIGFTTSSKVGGSTLKTRIEGDFYGAGSVIRLRHAYGEWNGILAGQTWTNFSGLLAGTPIVSFTGPTGRPAAGRLPQLRYTTGNLSVALEDPADMGGAVASEGAKSQLPELTVRYTDKSGPFKYSASAVARYLEYDTVGIETPSSDDTAVGWGAGLEASFDVSEAMTLRAGLSHGDGIGGYTHGNPKSAPAFVDTNGELTTIETTGGTAGASMRVGPGSINAAYSRSYANLDSNPAFATDNNEFEAAWLNYIWSPAQTPRINYGIELNWNHRETTDGRKGDATRLQGMVKYSF